MAQTQSRKAITVINPAPTFTVVGAADEMLSADVPLDALKASIKELIGECREMFEDAAQASGNARISHVDLSLAISVDGSVALIGTAGGPEAGGGIMVRLEFSNSSSSGTSVH
jgi:hypothetical protein